MLPIIDINQFRKGDNQTRNKIAKKIADGCRSIGFLYVINHGISDTVINTVKFELKEFFARPEVEKRAINRPKGHYRGYIPISHFSEDDQGQPIIYYESFLQGISLEEDDARIEQTQGVLSSNLWPAGERNNSFRQAAEIYWDNVNELSRDLLKAFAISLELDEDAFCRHFESQLTNISYLHYPPRPELREANNVPEPNAHYDTNALTILLPDPVGGLEVKMPDGSFEEVEPLEGAFVINIGNMMEAWSGGRYKSTMHRVNPPPGVERYSIGFFAVPNYDTLIEPIVPPEPDQVSRFTKPLHVGKNLASYIKTCDDMQELN